MENINFTAEVKDIRNYSAKIYCEDPYGKMVDILEITPDNFRKDLHIFCFLVNNAIFRGKRNIDVSTESLIYKWQNSHYNQKVALNQSIRTVIELFTATFIFDKKFKVFIYFDGYDPVLNPFYGFELFSSIEEFKETIDRFLSIDESLVWHNEKDLEEKLKPYMGGETVQEIRMNNIMIILIILFNKGR